MDRSRAPGAAYEAERSSAAEDATARILTNPRLRAEGCRPIRQDGGIVGWENNTEFKMMNPSDSIVD